MRSNSKNIEAIIISRRDWGEADRLLTAFSKHEGKIKIVARGARRIKSKMASHIEPFCYGKYSLVSGKGYDILTGADSEWIGQNFTDNISLYQDGIYLCEVLDMVTQENQPNEHLFEVFKRTLTALPKVSPSKQEILLREFEFCLLEAIGYQPQYDKCVICNKAITEDGEYVGNFEGLACRGCSKNGQSLDLKTIKVLRQLKRGGGIIQINGIEKYNSALKEIVSFYLYDILPKQPRSRIYERTK